MTENETITLRAYFEGRFVAEREYLDTRLAAMDMALVLAREQIAMRLESMNEFREEARATQAKYITRNEVDLINERICEAANGRDARLRIVENVCSAINAKASVSGLYISYVIALISMGLAIAHMYR
jgi:hypothetical protein